MLGATTNHSAGSSTLPGPTSPDHQPPVEWPGPAGPVRWLSPVSACKTSTALLASALSSPHDSKAIVTSGNLPPRSSAISPSSTNCRSPGLSPGRQAPDAGGAADKVRRRDSVTNAEGTASSGVCQSMSFNSVAQRNGPELPCYAARRSAVTRRGCSVTAAIDGAEKLFRRSAPLPTLCVRPRSLPRGRRSGRRRSRARPRGAPGPA